MKSADAVVTIRRVSAVVVLTAATLAAGYAMGETYNDGTIKWTYSIIDETSKSVEIETAESAVYIGKIAGDVIVPGNVDGYTVTSIGDSAFYNCCALYSVTIPDSVKFIGDSAFSGCNGLTSVTFSGDAPELGRSLFQGVSESCVARIPYGNDTYKIGYDDRWNGLKVEYYDAPAATLTIEGGVLKKVALNGASMVEIPDGVTSIANYAFFGEKGLKSVSIPESVESIGVKAFKGCSNLTKVTLPARLATLGQAAFQDCVSLTEVDVPSLGDNYLWSSTFEGCTALKRVSLPEGITAIGTSSFANCKALVEVNIPKSVRNIKSFAFFSCEKLSDVELPSNRTRSRTARS